MALQFWVLNLGQHVPGELFATWGQRLEFQRMNPPRSVESCCFVPNEGPLKLENVSSGIQSQNSVVRPCQ